MEEQSTIDYFTAANDDAIFSILERLSLEDLCSVSQTCIKLRDLAANHFSRSYPQLLLQKITVEKTNGTIDFKEKTNYVKCFGDKIESVEIKNCKYDKQLLHFMRTKCTENMKRIEFCGGVWSKLFLRGIRKILRNVEFIKLRWAEGVSLGDILRHCHRLKRLYLSGWLPNGAPCNYPHLEVLELNLKIDDEHTEELMKLMKAKELENAANQPAANPNVLSPSTPNENSATDNNASNENPSNQNGAGDGVTPEAGISQSHKPPPEDSNRVIYVDPRNFVKFLKQNPNIKRCHLHLVVSLDLCLRFLSIIAEYSEVEELFLSYDDFTPILKRLKFLDNRNSFKRLELYSKQYDSTKSVNLFDLAKLKKLADLRLIDTVIKENKTVPITNLQVLQLYRCELNEETAINLASNLPKLEKLHLNSVKGVSQVIEAFLAHSKSLSKIIAPAAFFPSKLNDVILSYHAIREGLEGACKLTVYINEKQDIAKCANEDLLVNIKRVSVKSVEEWHSPNSLLPYVYEFL